MVASRSIQNARVQLDSLIKSVFKGETKKLNVPLSLLVLVVVSLKKMIQFQIQEPKNLDLDQLQPKAKT